MVEIIKSFIPFTTVSDENINTTTPSLIATQQTQDVTSSDVADIYEKQSESVSEQKDSITLKDQPTSSIPEETTSTTESTTSQDKVPTSTVVDEGIIVSKPLKEKEDIELQQPLTTEKIFPKNKVQQSKEIKRQF